MGKTVMTTPTYFHACESDHAVGAIISTRGEENYYWRRLEAEGRNAANHALEAKRGALPSRRTCVFAAVDAGFALAFAGGQRLSRARLYEVEATGRVHRAPMYLTTALQKRLSVGHHPKAQRQIDEIVAAYWADEPEWKGLEVLADELRVVAQVVLSAEEALLAEAGARIGYDADLQRVARRWPAGP